VTAAGSRQPLEAARQHDAPGIGRAARIERHLVAMMLQVPAVLPDIERNHVLDYFENVDLKALGKLILDRFQEKGRQDETGPADGGGVAVRFVSEILDSVADDNQRRQITELTSLEEDWSMEGCQKLIAHFAETGRSRSSAKDISRKIREAEQNKDDRLLKKLLEEKQQLAVQRDKKRMALTEKL
jgi:hypothetical protein